MARFAALALFLVAMIWGATFPLIRNAMAHLDAISFVTYRFGMAACLMCLYYWFRYGKKALDFKQAPLGLSLGVLVGLSYLFQTLGLETINSGRAAFITGTNVFMVPMIAGILRHARVKKIDFIAAFIALLGLMLMTQAYVMGFSTGDYWVLISAIDYAIYVVLMTRMLNQRKIEPGQMAVWQVIGVAIMSLVLFGVDRPDPIPFHQEVIVALVFCAVFATVITFLLQSYAHQYLTPQKTALIYATEPVFAAIFGFLWLGETLSAWGIFGAFLILAASILPDLKMFKDSESQPAASA